MNRSPRWARNATWLCALAGGGLAGGCSARLQALPATAIVAPRIDPSGRSAAADSGALPPLGARYTGSVPMLGRSIALPNGQWQVVVQQRDTFSFYPAVAQVVLLRTDQEQMTGVLEIGGNAAGKPSDKGWPLNVTCQNAARFGANPAILAAEARRVAPGGDQDCVLVAFLTTARWRSSSRSQSMQGLSRALDTLGIVPPPVAIVAGFGETDRHYRLVEQLWLNPDLAGIAPDPEPRPMLNAWAFNRLKDDTARRAYVERVMAWAQTWRPVVRQALNDPGLNDPATVAPPGVAEIR